MKKLYTFLSLAVCALSASAQLTLPQGSTLYTQNFDTIANGLPHGWFCYSSASATSLGTAGATFYTTAEGTYYDTTDCASDIFSHAFKNSASADTALDTMSCAEQSAVKNRALSVRQSSNATYDPGVSFVFELANTVGFGSFNLGFELQGLDILSARTTTWTVDYGIGAAPTTFTPVTPLTGTLTTGNSLFTNNKIGLTFGHALDNQSTPVWIRISALTASTGSGSRTTSAIDNFTLTYVGGVGIPTIASQAVSFKTLGMASANQVNFACTVANEGNYSLNMYDITGRLICTKQVELTPGVQTNISVTDKNLVAGMYIARITDGNTMGITKVIVQ